MNALLTDGLLDLFDRILLRYRPNIERACVWLRETATPPSNLVFRTDDNQVYTGLVVLERNRAVLMLAVRNQGPVGATSFQQPYRAPVNHSPAQNHQRVIEVPPSDDSDEWDPSSPFYCPR